MGRIGGCKGMRRGSRRHPTGGGEGCRQIVQAREEVGRSNLWCFAREEVGIVTVISGPGGGGPVDRSGSDPWEEVRVAA